MKVLVIGGTGLISTQIVDQLAERGDEVTVFNRGETKSRLARPVRAIAGDRWDYPAFEAAMQNERFDAVIDMVAYAPENAESILRAFEGKVKHVVVCSTVCVYGGPLTKDLAAEDEPHRPVTDYGRNKSKIEATLLAASGLRGTFATAIRPSFTTGEGTVLSGTLFDDTLVDRMRKGLDVVVHDDGSTPWAISHASDVARAFVNSLLNERAYGQAYHVTSDEHTTWNGVFSAMNEAAGGTARLVHVPSDWLREHFPRRSVGVHFIYRYASIFDNRKAARDLDFRTTVPLVETFQRQIQWMEGAGKVSQAGEDPFQDEAIRAFRAGVPPLTTGAMDANPWGNETVL